MTRLLRAELARARARPLVWCVVVGVALAVVALVLTGWWDSRPPSPDRLAAADAAYRAAVEDWRATLDASPAPDRAQFLAPPPHVLDLVAGRLPSVGFMLAVGSLMIGVGLVTAEFASGSIGTWLTFAPRRGPVLVSKLVAAVTAALPCGLAALGTLVGGLLLVGVAHGLPLGLGDPAWSHLAAVAARWLVAGAAFAALGVGLAFALRHAAAVTGVVVWWVAATESALPLVLPSLRSLTLSRNVAAWTAGRADYVVPACVPAPSLPGGEVCQDVVHTVSMGHGAAVVGLTVVVALVAGALSFRLRDV